MTFNHFKSVTRWPETHGSDQTAEKSRLLDRSMNPVDWLIAAGAAAFIAAGIIAVLPFGAEAPNAAGASETARASTAASDADETSVIGRNALMALFAKPDETPDVAEPEANAGPVVPADGVRKVATEAIRITPVIDTGPVETAALGVTGFSVSDRRVPGGCGLMLTQKDDQNAIVFFHEMASGNDRSQGFVLVDETMVALTRTDRSGDPVGFGQYPLQVFETEDGAVKAIVDIHLGAAAEDSLRLPVTKGQLIVTTGDGRTATLPVSGDAGC